MGPYKIILTVDFDEVNLQSDLLFFYKKKKKSVRVNRREASDGMIISL